MIRIDLQTALIRRRRFLIFFTKRIDDAQMIVRKGIAGIGGDDRFEALDRLVVISHRTIRKSQIIIHIGFFSAE